MSARKTKRPSLALGSLGESFDDDSNAGRRGPDDIPEIPPDVGDNRLLFVNCHEGHVGKFKSNHISTTKYNVINFLPKQLYEQFRRLANAYFLLIILIQFIPNLTPLNPFASIFPLALVLFISAVKEFVEDMRRRKQDRQINNRSAHVIKDGRVEHVTWNNVRVGDLCLVRNTEPFPADLVAIDSSEPQGVCYIETMNLDGETNLKFRQVKHMKTKASKLEHEALENSNIRAAVICESPNSMLYNFEGTVIRNGRPLAVGLRQFLLRGASLRNTEWIVGIAVYTGHDSKLMQNAMSPPSKRSQVDRVMNSFVALIFVFQLIVCLCAGLGFFLESEKNIGNASYLGSLTQGPILQSSLFTFLTFLILLNVMIPISLYVSTEMVRVAQGYFMQMDEEMYHAETNTRCKARTSNLNEELGQVEYVFSDKTGTLTQNKMEFLKCSVGGVAYGHAVTEAQRGQAVREGRPIDEEYAHVKVSKDDRFFFDDPLIFEHLESGAKNAHLIDLFLTMMAVCHTAMPRLAPGADVSTVEYQASSPDEGALVDAARGLGYMFYERDPDAVTVAVEDEDRRYEVLNVLEFTSARKRMSVIVRDPAGRIVIYTKGADSIVYDRLAPDKSQRDLARRTRRHLQRFASDGLRTLVFAYAPLDPEVYEDWDERYKAAQTQVSGRDEAVAEVADEIERNLFLVGASAIEDKLQEGVPQAIREILAANIKLWVLTGDKLETAINIGFSCSILHEAMTLLVISGPDIDHIEQQIDDAINDYNPLVFTDGELGLVIEGSSLEHALARDDVALKFLRLGMFCKSVVCCRVSPLQKAKVVLLVKNNLNAVTLAIGDGANDVSMIQAAHLGIGISGNEGMQAVMASDYAIAQFRFLKRLLLVHGRWNYKRLSKLILYSFYKNMAFTMPQFWYSWYNSFSGQTLYESLLVPLFNVFFAGLPVIVLTSLDQDVSARNSLRFPTLYEAGQKKVDFNKMLFITWIMSGIIHSSVVFFIVLFTADPTMSVYEFGSVIYTAVVLVVNGRLAMEINYLTWLHVAAILSSVLAFFALLFLSSIVPGSLPHMYHVAHSLYVSPRYWLIVIIATAAALLPEIAYKYIRRTYSPRLYHVIRWLHHKGIDMDNYAQDVADAVNATRLGLSERELADMIDPEQQHTRRGTNQIVSQRTGFAFSMEDSQPANIASSVVMPITAIQRWKRKARDNVNTRTALGGAAAGTGILAAGAGTGRLATSMRRRSIQSNSTPDGRKQSTSRSGRRAGSSLAAAAKASETRSRSPARTEESNGGGGGGGGRQRRKRRASQTASQRSSHRSARSDRTAKSRRTGRRRSDASETARSSARGKASRLKRASPSLESAAHGGGTSRRGSRVRREVGVAEDRPPKSPTSALAGGGGGRRRSNRVGPR